MKKGGISLSPPPPPPHTHTHTHTRARVYVRACTHSNPNHTLSVGKYDTTILKGANLLGLHPVSA